MNLEYLNNIQNVHRHKTPDVVESVLIEGHSVVCTFNRRGTLLASGCHDGRVVIWDFETRSVARILVAHVHAVTSLSWSRNGRHLLSASTDARVLIWDIMKGVPIFSYPAESAVLAASLHPTQPLFLANLVGGVSLLMNWKTEQIAQINLAQILQLPIQNQLKDDDVHDDDDDMINNHNQNNNNNNNNNNHTTSTTTTTTTTTTSSSSSTTTLTPSASSTSLSIFPTTTLFSKHGDYIFLGTNRGMLLILEHDASLRLHKKWHVQLDEKGRPGTLSIRGMYPSLNGKYLLLNGSDKAVRIFVGLESSSLSHRAPCSVWTYVNVDKIHLSYFGFSADGEVLVLGSSDRKWPEVFLETVDERGRPSWSAEKISSCEDSFVYVAWHPLKTVLAACSTKGCVNILGTKAREESWSAYIPGAGFKELETNEVYLEQEDEFDRYFSEDEYDDGNGEEVGENQQERQNNDPFPAPKAKRPRSNRAASAVSEDENVDIMTITPIPGYSPESDDELLYLPTPVSYTHLTLPTIA